MNLVFLKEQGDKYSFTTFRVKESSDVISVIFDVKYKVDEQGLRSMCQDLYVIKDTGECLYHKSNSSDSIDPAIVSSFLSAVEIFGQNVDAGAKLLQTGNSKFVYHHLNDGMILVARVPIASRTQQVEKILERLGKKIKQLGINLNNFDGNVSSFKKLDDELSFFNDSSYPVKEVPLEINPRLGFRLINGSELERKIYSLIRFKHRSNIKELASLLRTSETEVYTTIQKLVRKNILRPVQTYAIS